MPIKALKKILPVTALAMSAQTAFAEPVVVVELYTSQGCSSCPAADKILTEISNDKGVLALGFHVDYWDYLGWRDQFADPKFTERQRIYNRVLPSKYTLVTPQMIFQGQSHLAGANRAGTAKTLKELRGFKSPAVLKAQLKGNNVSVSVQAVGNKAQSSDVFMVTYTPKATVAIKRGENTGRTITYTNIVSKWEKIGTWDGKSPKSISAKVTGDGRNAIIVQAKGTGPILAAETIN